MNLIFQIDGGIGKSIAATAVCKAMKRQYPDDKLIVITGYPEVFLCNPYVDKALSFNNLNYFYEDNIANREVLTFLHNPYADSNFINHKGHLIEVWCHMFGIKYNGELPELYINATEQAGYLRNFASTKPLMLLQTNGGGGNQSLPYSWARDIPLSTAQKVVDAFANKYQVVHIRRNDQPSLQHTVPLQSDFRAIAALIAHSEKRLFIDSFCQHAAMAMGSPSVVCWIGNSPLQFGYPMHLNVVSNAPTIKADLRHSVFSRYNISGTPTEFPYRNESEVFDLDTIIDAIERQPSKAPARIETKTAAPINVEEPMDV